MKYMRKTLSMLLVLGIVLSACNADEKNTASQEKNTVSQEKNTASQVNNEQAKNSEQTESCVVDNDNDKSFLGDFGIKADGFENVPTDVKCFVENAMACEHFAGEEAYDEERGKEIENGLMKYCIEAQKQMKVLKEKYNARTDVHQILTLCEKKNLGPGEEPVCASFDPKDLIEE